MEFHEGLDNSANRPLGPLCPQRSVGTQGWDTKLREFLATTPEVHNLELRERLMERIPVTLPSGEQLQLSAGGQNELIKAIIEEFCPRFTPGGVILYIGDAGKKQVIMNVDHFAKLNLRFDPHGKMPDVVIYHIRKNWLVVIEAA